IYRNKFIFFFFFSSRRRHTRFSRDWSSDVCSSDLKKNAAAMAKAFVDKGYNIISDGTDNHMMLIDLRNKDISGKEAEEALGEAKIGRASCRERVENSGVDETSKKKIKKSTQYNVVH